MPYLNVTLSLYLLINDSSLRGVHGKTGRHFRGRRGSGTQGRAFRKRGGSPRGQQEIYPGQYRRCRSRSTTLDTRTATDAELDLIIAHTFLVIAALSDQAENDRIGALCQEHGVLFNNADGEPGDVVIPAMTMGAHYTIAISTGSESPAVSRFLRQEIERKYPALDAMIVLQHRLRETLKEKQATHGRAAQDPLRSAPRQTGLDPSSKYRRSVHGNGYARGISHD